MIDGLWSPSETLVDQVGGVRPKVMSDCRPTWFYIFYFDTLFYFDHPLREGCRLPRNLGGNRRRRNREVPETR